MKNLVLKAITGIATAAAMLGACSMDSDNLVIPAVMVAVGGAWLTLFGIANREERA